MDEESLECHLLLSEDHLQLLGHEGELHLHRPKDSLGENLLLGDDLEDDILAVALDLDGASLLGVVVVGDDVLGIGGHHTRLEVLGIIVHLHLHVDNVVEPLKEGGLVEHIRLLLEGDQELPDEAWLPLQDPHGHVHWDLHEHLAAILRLGLVVELGAKLESEIVEVDIEVGPGGVGDGGCVCEGQNSCQEEHHLASHGGGVPWARV